MAYQDLAYAVVTQAVEDYKYRNAIGLDVTELREFFNSRWCELLLKEFQMSGQEILAQLEG